MTPLSIGDLQRVLDDFTTSGRDQGVAVSPPLASSSRSKPLSRMGRALATPTSVDLEVLEEALSYISSDVLRGSGSIIGPDGKPDPEYWFGVILACCREYGDAAKEIVRRWSQTSARYLDGSGFEHAWNQYDPARPNPVTIGSVFMLAKLMGWPGRGHSVSPPINVSRFELLDRAAIMAQPPLRWRVKKLLPETGIAAIYGASGSGKSFGAIDLGVTIALGDMWFGRRTAACPVTYIALEGEGALRNRIQAWETHNKRQIPCDFQAIIQPFEVAEPKQVEELGGLLPKGGVVIIDTLNRSAPGLDENSSQDMGRILAGMKRLQHLTAGLVVVVHHTGKDASKGMRGHSSLHAALDGAIEVERTASGRFWSAAKVKDGEDGNQTPFMLHVIDLGVDADGDPITSCAIGSDTAAIFRPPEPSGKSQKAALKTIRGLLRNSTTVNRAGCGQQTQCIKVEDAIASVAATLTTKAPNKRSNEARRLVGALVSGGYLKSALETDEEAWLWQ